MYRLVIVVLITAVLLTAACGRNDAVRPASSGADIEGIDVSSHQNDIDWERVAGDTTIRFAYVKATEGATYRSPHYLHNVSGAQRNGIAAGSYHYLSTSSAVRAQFRNFVATTSQCRQDLLPMIDVEHRRGWTRQQLIDSLTLMANLIEGHFGAKPIIYSTIEFYNANLAPHFNTYPLYIGRYSTDAPGVKWNGHYSVWQYTDEALVVGIPTYVDRARLAPTLTLDDLRLPQAR